MVTLHVSHGRATDNPVYMIVGMVKGSRGIESTTEARFRAQRSILNLRIGGRLQEWAATRRGTRVTDQEIIISPDVILNPEGEVSPTVRCYLDQRGVA